MTRRGAGEGTVRQRPSGRWEARYVSADGARRSVYGKTKREVTNRLREALQDAAHGLRPVSQQITTASYLDEWVSSLTVRPRTAESYGDVVRRYLKPALGRVPLAKLQPEHVTRMLRDLEQRQPPLSPTTVRYAYVVLRIALGRALKVGKVHRNVATLVDSPTKARREVQPMTAAEARVFLESVRGDRLEVLYRLAVATGMRQGELLALRWQDVDLDGGSLEVRHTLVRGTRELAPPKTEQARRHIALDGDTLAMLRAHRLTQASIRVPEHDRDFVFTTRDGQPFHARNVLHAYHDALASAGMPRRTFHQLRHGFATLLLENGEELANISKALGHSTFTTTVDFYGHLTPGISRRAADRMGAILAG